MKKETRKKGLSFLRYTVVILLLISMMIGFTVKGSAVGVDVDNEPIEKFSSVVQQENDYIIEDTSTNIVTYVNPMFSAVIDTRKIAELWNSIPQITNYSLSEVLEIEEAAKVLRSKMVARETYVEIKVKMKEYRRTEVPMLVYTAAIEHTGIPNEGDYIVYNGCAWSAMTDYENIGDGYIFTIKYIISYFTDAQQEAEVDSIVKMILGELNLWNATDYEKVLGIYRFICDNVSYDYANVDNLDYTRQFTAYAALVDKTAVCQGYALLFYRLALELGVDTRLITGDGGGMHAWNIVCLGGQYFNLDATWDAGQSDYSYFLRGNEMFADHLPDEQFTTIQFQAQYPISIQDYIYMNEPDDGVLGSGVCGDGCIWTFSTNNVLQISGVGKMQNYSMRSAPWSQYAYRIQQIEISEEITGIGSYAFSGCTALGIVEIPENVKSIGEGAFYECVYLSDIKLPSNLMLLENMVFFGCVALAEIEIPRTVDIIGEKAFANCTHLKEIIFPDGLKSIGNSAFSNCNDLVKLQLPESVTIIGDNGFAGCTNLVFAYFWGNVPECGVDIFAGTPDYFCVYYSDVASGWSSPNWNGYASAIWTDSVLENMGDCGPSAFWVYGKDGTLTIWGEGEVNFETLYDPGITPWSHVLYEINRIVIKEGITAIGNFAFTNAQNVTMVLLPEGLTRIGWGAFYNCYSLKKVDLPDTLSIIDTCAFEFCHELKNVYIPAGVVQINAQSFTGCQNLEAISVDLENPRYYAVDGVLLDRFDESVKVYPAGKTEKSYQIPQGVICIEDGAFSGAQFSTIDIPSSVQTIRNGAFGGSAIEKIIIPDGVTVIHGGTFSDCSKLVEILIPEGVFKIETGAFSSCTSLKEVAFPSSLQEIEMSAFSWCTGLKKVSIPAGQTAIYEYTFANCWSLEEVTIPDSIEVIEQFAFNNCTNLNEVTIPYGTVRINNGAFMDCTNLINITIPQSVISIGADAFKNTPWIEKVTDDNGFVVINNSLYGYFGDSAVPIIPDCVTAISSFAFAYSDSIVSIIIPESISIIENYTFYGCHNLSRVYIPETVTRIGLGAFGACSTLSMVNYSGNYEQWDMVTIEGDNSALSQEKIRCNFIQYEVLTGENGIVDISNDESFVLSISAKNSDTDNVVVAIDGEIVDSKSFAVSEEGNSVILQQECLKRLGEGNHTVELILANGAAFTQIVVVHLHSPGDINGDSKINNKDVTRLLQYLSGWNVEIEEAMMDVNGDGKVNNKDATRLLQYLSNWEVKIY